MQLSSKKLYYKIGEACKILNVEPHVLRYWETEFSCLSPPKSRSGQRTYRPRDIELLLRIRKLLYEDGFTIAGARRQLGTRVHPTPGTHLGETPGRRRAKAVPEGPKPTGEPLEKVRKELQNILTLLDRG